MIATKNDRVCIVPGTFDPVTNGHLDIIMRAAKLFDRVYVAAFINSAKKNMFSPKERGDMLNLACSGFDSGGRVVTDVTDKLLADYAEMKGAGFVVKGVRNTIDYDYEYSLFLINREISINTGKSVSDGDTETKNTGETGIEIDTILLPSKNEHLYISSAFVREMIIYDKDISSYVPPRVCEYIRKLKKLNSIYKK